MAVQFWNDKRWTISFSRNPGVRFYLRFQGVRMLWFGPIFVQATKVFLLPWVNRNKKPDYFRFLLSFFFSPQVWIGCLYYSIVRQYYFALFSLFLYIRKKWLLIENLCIPFQLDENFIDMSVSIFQTVANNSRKQWTWERIKCEVLVRAKMLQCKIRVNTNLYNKSAA